MSRAAPSLDPRVAQRSMPSADGLSSPFCWPCSARTFRCSRAGTQVIELREKPTPATGWVSGGFFLFQREFAERYLDDSPELLLEQSPLQQVARDGQLGIFGHEGFCAGMDTIRDRTDLNRRWDAGDPP